MSALPPKADIAKRYRHVRFVPTADIPSLGPSPGLGRDQHPPLLLFGVE
jgi:hypothetical protein